MGQVIEKKTLKAKINLPEPLLAEHWITYWEKLDKYLAEGNRATSPGVMLRSKFLAALSVLEGATYTLKGEVHDVMSEGLKAPLPICRWVAAEVDEQLAAQWELPKD